MVLGFSFKNAQCTVFYYFECQTRSMQGERNRREGKKSGEMALNMFVKVLSFCLRLIVFSSSFPK